MNPIGYWNWNSANRATTAKALRVKDVVRNGRVLTVGVWHILTLFGFGFYLYDRRDATGKYLAATHGRRRFRSGIGFGFIRCTYR